MTKSKKEKKKRSFPSAFTVLFIVLVFAAVLTFVVPAGSYERLQYDTEGDQFIKIGINGEETSLPATQEVLDEHKITIPLESFKNQDIKKPVAIPGSYDNLEQRPQGFKEVVRAPIDGIADSIGIIVFVLILGGCIGVLNETGTFDAGMAALSKKTKGKEFIMVAIISSIIALGGTTFGLAEETIAFYPILLPIFLASGFDAMVAIAAIYMGSSVGTMFSTTNAFSVVVASNAAGINFKTGLTIRIIALVLGQGLTLWYIYRYTKKVKKDPALSVVAEDMPRIKKQYLDNYDPENVVSFNFRRIAMLILFVAAFPIMIYGVMELDWWFEEMSTLFLVLGIALIILSGLPEQKAVGSFLNGAADLVSVALIIGVARGINIILDDGMISDTMLYNASNIIEGINGVVFSSVQMILFAFLGIFIPSSSGLATLSMPIIAPLADTVSIGRDVVVSAYNFGQGWMAIIAPTGLILATLEMVEVSYNKWIKFILPLMGMLLVLALVMLGVQTVF
ncbi:MAG: YfcC family protein [Lagierella massiliensis]|nr:YfcC family protein [Lagierella massiliensis]